MDRLQSLQSWAKLQLNDSECYLKPASNDASFRSYWRVFSQDKTYIIMDAPPEHEDCIPFITISQILNNSGVLVPIVKAQDLKQGFLLLTDLGTVQYLNVLNKNTFKALYNDACDALHTIQQQTTHENIPEYNSQLLSKELCLFEEWFISEHLGINLNLGQKSTLDNALKLLIDNALNQPQTFVHRDYHSRNLMKTKNNNPGILDFQDAVIGPITYDLVSLLKDCYISWDKSLVNELSDKFRQKYNLLNDTNINSKQWQRWFDLMGVQRHLKVLGIFCRLNYRDDKPGYLKDLNLTLHYVYQVCSQYDELQPLMNLIKDITPNMDTLCKP
jgi:aminoglycoside/choline kinase family phosphotransferase